MAWQASAFPQRQARSSGDARRSGNTLTDEAELPRKRRERARSVLGDGHVVLDPDPDIACAVESRLDRDHVSGREPLAVSHHDLRRLVHVEPEAVAGLVHDHVREGRGTEHVRHRAVQIVRRDSGPGDAAPERVRRANGLVDVRMAVAHMPAEDGARDIRAVAAALRPEIDQERIAGPERRAVGRSVRVRRLGARQHDRLEAELFRPVGEHPALQQRGDGALGIAGADLVEGLGQRPLADLDGAGEAGDLVLVLGDAQRLEVGVGIAHRAILQMTAERIVFEHAHPPALDAQGDGSQLGCRRREGVLEAIAVLPVEGACIGKGAAPLEALERGHDGENPGAGRDEEQRRPLHQREVEAGEIGEAGTGHEGGGIEAGGADQRGRAGAAPGMARHSAASPSPVRSTRIAAPKRGSSERTMIAKSARNICSIARSLSSASPARTASVSACRRPTDA